MTTSVDDVFRRLERGEMSPRELSLDDGWEATLPGGQRVTRSQLQGEARPLIALGIDAIPELIRWADVRNPALRYVATFTLAQLTGLHPELRHFDDDDTDGARARALADWRIWYISHASPPTP